MQRQRSSLLKHKWKLTQRRKATINCDNHSTTKAIHNLLTVFFFVCFAHTILSWKQKKRKTTEHQAKIIKITCALISEHIRPPAQVSVPTTAVGRFHESIFSTSFAGSRCFLAPLHNVCNVLQQTSSLTTCTTGKGRERG